MLEMLHRVVLGLGDHFGNYTISTYLLIDRVILVIMLEMFITSIFEGILF
jgi:hypothetical protein